MSSPWPSSPLAVLLAASGCAGAVREDATLDDTDLAIAADSDVPDTTDSDTDPDTDPAADDTDVPDDPEACPGGGHVFWRSRFTDPVADQGMTLNGVASQLWDGFGQGRIRLAHVHPRRFSAGSAMIDEPVPGDTWTARLRFRIGGGSGADGIAFVFLSETDPTYLGEPADRLGASGGAGHALAMWTWADHARFGLVDTATWSTLATRPGPIVREVGEVTAEVTYDAGHVELRIDGEVVLDEEVLFDARPPERMTLGVTAGTGGADDDHDLLDLVVCVP